MFQGKSITRQGLFLHCFLFAVVCLLLRLAWGKDSNRMNQPNSREKSDVQECINNLNILWGFITAEESSQPRFLEFIEYAANRLDRYAPKIHASYLSVSMRADDPPTIEMHRMAVDVAALAYFMVDKKIWFPQSEKFLPFLGLTVKEVLERKYQNAFSDQLEYVLTYNYDELINDFPVILYFSKNGMKSIPILLDEFQRKERFDLPDDFLTLSNIEHRLRCVSLIATILLNESGYPMKDPTPEIEPETWHRIARETWREISKRMADDDAKFKETATVVFNGRTPFYMALSAYPPDPVKYPKIKRSEEEYQRIMKYVPDL